MGFTCPCCGHRTFSEPPGSYDVCPICYWEDDPVQLLDPAYRGGANSPSLIDCQLNYEQFGACEQHFVENVRPPHVEECRDLEWRLVHQADLAHVRSPRELTNEEYARAETWYYWKRSSI